MQGHTCEDEQVKCQVRTTDRNRVLRAPRVRSYQKARCLDEASQPKLAEMLNRTNNQCCAALAAELARVAIVQCGGWYYTASCKSRDRNFAIFEL